MMAYRVDDALTAHTILITTLDGLEDIEQRHTALKLIREWLDRNRPVLTVEELIVRGAQARILGETVAEPSFEPTKKPADRQMFELLAKAWLTWATGGDPSPLLQTSPKPNEYGGAIHMMALEPWGAAIRALSERNDEEARRLFRRSIELGTQCATETNEVVQWTYAASFYHRGT